jgi:glutamine synthetase
MESQAAPKIVPNAPQGKGRKMKPALPGVYKTNNEVFMNAPFDQLFTWLKDHKITEVECVVSDLTGIARGKIAPTSSCMSAVCACRRACCCKR